MKTFLFYDIETSGLNTAFDQILTFAAIRTDLGLKEIDRTSVVVQLRPDVVPSPGAFITHRLSPASLMKGVCEYDAALAIHRIINAPGTISLGYNTLGFDDEFLRFTFYRNLLDPYTHQYANGCFRMDILPLAVLYRLFVPLDIHWPENDGKPSMKLELISKENALVTSGRAHDAMVDVEATLALAQRLFTRGEMWDYCRTFFNKAHEPTHMGRLERRKIGLAGSFYLGIMVSLSFGAKYNYMAPVLCIGPSRVYGNQTLWLRLDAKGFPGGEAEPVDPDKIFIIRKKKGEPPIVLPPLERFWGRLSPEQQTMAHENMEILANHFSWFTELIEYHKNYTYPVVPDLDADAGLYQEGFFSSMEKNEMAGFHRAAPAGRLDSIKKMSCPRVKNLAARVLFRNFSSEMPPEALDENGGFDRESYMERVRRGGLNPIKGFRNDIRYGADQALKEIADLLADRKQFDAEQIALLEEIHQHIQAM
ncbi:Exodeoxyribonuclease I subunit C [Desulfocicer vacuolatum DSM 3385]|uniref:Exodeoxyribonuclease I subunit C n=1 Tax=Desulfocicer vacuolatum DSM 3385 TaxID=1121400 RepID=A0A1W1ZD38_9BACT|nr:exodeoxyribonuclease I [Desulfocicer vacuolatum]SMC46350.1 Exodeoxyribonuclease I subunit C [Desulfocicer vacuolatum DSM 3385]